MCSSDLLICSVGLILYMNFSDGSRGIQREVRERDYFFTPAFVFTAMLMGAGVVAVLNQIKTWIQQTNLPSEAVTVGGVILTLALDRKSTRLNSSQLLISYADFRLKTKISITETNRS